MVCPICKNTQNIIKNNYYFCPNCQIYISKASNVNTQNTKITPTAYQTLFNNAPPLKTLEPKEITKMDKVKKFGVNFAIFLFLLIFYQGFISINNYIDIQNLCRIKIESRFTDKIIKDSISKLKDENSEDYKNLCQNINKIVEGYCLTDDPHIHSNQSGFAIEAGGCYIKGTKTVFLNPSQYGGSNEQRLEMLIKGANYSKAYHQN